MKSREQMWGTKATTKPEDKKRPHFNAVFFYLRKSRGSENIYPEKLIDCNNYIMNRFIDKIIFRIF